MSIISFKAQSESGVKVKKEQKSFEIIINALCPIQLIVFRHRNLFAI